MNKANALVLKAAKPPSQRAQNPLTPPSALARTLTTGVMTPLPARAPVPTQRHAVQLPLTLRSAERSSNTTHLLNCSQRLGTASLFVTVALDDAHHPLSARTAA